MLNIIDNEICTTERPYSAELDKKLRAEREFYFRWVHPSAICTYDGDDYERYECPICGTRFAVELAQ